MEDTRVAAAVPQKVTKIAAIRNKLRRKTYEGVRTFRTSIRPGTHAIVFAKPAAVNSKHADLVADVKDLFVKAGLLR
jgi:ribonuclease P protein component